jgi:hypothetical protein
MKETELAAAIVEWLKSQHWDVYQEVQFNRGSAFADIAACNGNLLWIIECKTTATIKVIEQARKWHTAFRSIAVPYSRRPYHPNNFFEIICRKFDIGVIRVRRTYNELEVEVTVPAPLMRDGARYASAHLIPRLMPEHKTAAMAGTNAGGRWTPYRSTIWDVEKFIKGHPGATMKEIATGVKSHYSNDQSAMCNLRKALEVFEKDTFRVDRSKRPFRYFLRQKEA